ncbi:indolepyruvate ferredoxin oxidreductase, alpha/beta subunit [Rhizobium leguminosarum bv. trifolii WSM597]|uniref:Ferredoxin-like protein in nif region n=1 Tax=Rhizobium leguminosarum bv. trifolii WSM597 TaxID=754764 RepID=I9NK89_RHILT|nr:4Fe-4S binding protein [Rhizobium leguminosarum]EJB07182.1 indolepyruvate ferredoxin oxidreductase, alpha/beta subunit [Rhizobium leguminosarum bv. trifolii WSM597]
MAFKIIASQCTQCGACEFECPSGAISFKIDKFVVDPNICTECKEEFDAPKCRAICPVQNTCVPA